MEKQLDGPIPRVPEAIRGPDRGPQDVANVAGNSERDHRKRKCDRYPHCGLLRRTEPLAANGAQRVLRMAKGESTKRSELDAEELIACLRQVGVEQLRQSEEEEVWLIG